MCFFSVFCLKLYLSPFFSTPGSKNWDRDSNSHQRPTWTWYKHRDSPIVKIGSQPIQQPGWGWYVLDECCLRFAAGYSTYRLAAGGIFHWKGGVGGRCAVVGAVVGVEVKRSWNHWWERKWRHVQVPNHSGFPKDKKHLSAFERRKPWRFVAKNDSTEKNTLFCCCFIRPCAGWFLEETKVWEKIRKNDCSMEEILQQLG